VAPLDCESGTDPDTDTDTDTDTGPHGTAWYIFEVRFFFFIKSRFQ